MLSIICLGFELALMAALKAFGLAERTDPYMLLMIAVFSLAYAMDLKSSKRPRGIKFAFFAGYVFRLALLMLDIFGRNIYVLPNSGADSEGFYHTAVAIAGGKSWDNMEISSFAGSIFKVIGVSRLYMQFLFLCFSLVALFAANRILEELRLDTRRRTIAMTILCLLPNYAILSVLFLRESLIACMVALSLLLFIYWLTGRPEYYFWLSFLPILFAAMFHGGVMGVLIGYFVVRCLYDRRTGRFRLSLRTMLPALLAAFVLVYLFNNYSDVFFEKMQNVEEISDVGSTSDMGGSSYAKLVGDSTSVGNMIRYSPIRIIMFQFSPFPWQVRGLSDVIAICFNGAFYVYVWYKTIRYIFASKRYEHRSIVIALFIVWFFTTFVFAWGVTNVGTAVRHRDKMVVIGGVLLGLTMNRKNLPPDEKYLWNEG